MRYGGRVNAGRRVAQELATKLLLEAGQKVVEAQATGMFRVYLDESCNIVREKIEEAEVYQGYQSTNIEFDQWAAVEQAREEAAFERAFGHLVSRRAPWPKVPAPTVNVRPNYLPGPSAYAAEAWTELLREKEIELSELFMLPTPKEP